MDRWTSYESPVGMLTLVSRDGGLRRLLFPGRAAGLSEDLREPAAFADAQTQLDEYFAGERRDFDLPLEPIGSPFQLRVWKELLQVPYGATISYKELAERVDRPGEAREVGAVVAQTPLPILVPCHRVIGSNGDLTGYGGGLERKQALLDLETAPRLFLTA